MKDAGRAALLLAGTIATLVACGGGGATNSGPGPVRTSSVDGVATISIPLRAPQGRTAQFISFFVKSATIAINGAVVTTADLSATSAICQAVNESARTCTIPLTAPAGNDSFTATLYDGANGTSHVLGIGVATLAVGGASFSLPITVGGVAVSLTINAQTTTLQTGNATTIPLTFTAKDAAGAVIAGADPFANPITLTNSDTSGHTHLSATALGSPQTAVSLAYDGGAVTAPVTIGATGGGSTTVTPVVITVVVATPTPTPTPTPGIPSLGFSGNGYSCSGTSQLELPGTYLVFVSEGVLDSTGAYSSQIGEWAPIQFLAPSSSPAATPSPTATPTPSPTPSSSPTIYAYLYTGNFSLSQPFNGMQGGCFYAVAFPGRTKPVGSSIARKPLTASASGLASPSSTPSPNAVVLGAPNVGDNATIGTVGTVGTITAITVTVNQTAGTGSGTFTLDNGSSGTITINGTLAFAQARKRIEQSIKLRQIFEAARRRH